MAGIYKAKLTETDTITRFIFLAVKGAGWDDMRQIRQKVRLWQKYCAWRGFTATHLPIITQDYHDGGSCKSPCCYQLLLLCCDEFKARLQHAQQTQLHLADVLVAKALA